MNFKTIVSPNYLFEIDEDSVKQKDILTLSDNQYHIIEQENNYLVKIDKKDFKNKKYRIVVNGNPYEVAIQDQLDMLIDEMGLSLIAEEKESEIKSPMPGLILSIEINEGDQVKEGDNLLVLEAMKMENMLLAPADGVVKKIHANKGDAVEKGVVLIEME